MAHCGKYFFILNDGGVNGKPCSVIQTFFRLTVSTFSLLGPIGTPLQLQIHAGHFCSCEDDIYSKHTKPNRTITEDFMVEQQKMQAVPK